MLRSDSQTWRSLLEWRYTPMQEHPRTQIWEPVTESKVIKIWYRAAHCTVCLVNLLWFCKVKHWTWVYKFLHKKRRAQYNLLSFIRSTKFTKKGNSERENGGRNERFLEGVTLKISHRPKYTKANLTWLHVFLVWLVNIIYFLSYAFRPQI